MGSISGQLTGWIATHGVYAVFVLMAVDALLPVGGELIMLYAGGIAAGAVACGHPTLIGVTLASGIESYVVLALAGSLGYLAGALVGWGIGVRGGRALLERHGRWLHLGPARLRQAEAWFARYGSVAVPLGRITPLVRSFISIPAGVLGSRLAPYALLTFAGSLLWCFGFAAAGWALGSRWEAFHHGFRFADDAAVAGLVLAGAIALWRWRRRTTGPGRSS